MAVSWQSDTVTYRENGSYQFSAAQRKAYALILDIKILTYVGQASQNFRSNPPRGFWGNATIFEKNTPRERIQLEFPNFRLLRVHNDYVANTFNTLAIAADQNRQLTDVGEIVESIWTFFGPDLLLAPALKHREKVVKFRGLPLSQFEFNCYWLPFSEFDADFPDFNPDPPGGEPDQYYEPTQNPTTDPFGGNPQPSAPNPQSDPRDFENSQSGAVLFTGTLTYEYRRADTGEFEAFTEPNVNWPGRLVPDFYPQFRSSIVWLDDLGNDTNMSINDNFDSEVRFVQFEAPGGQIFIPDPNALVDERDPL